MKKRISIQWSLMALPILMMAACSAPAHIEKDKHTDFSQFKSFSWIDHNNGKKGNSNDLEEQKVHDAVSRELAKSGWREVSDNPDVIVSYDVLIDKGRKKESNPVYSTSYSRLFFNPYTRRYGTIYYPSQFLGYDNYNVPVTQGTLTITMVDARRDRTVWQGWTTDEINSRHLTSGEIQSSVRAIFRKFDVAQR
jgi:hypothetical protein